MRWLCAAGPLPGVWLLSLLGPHPVKPSASLSSWETAAAARHLSLIIAAGVKLRARISVARWTSCWNLPS